MIDLLHCCLFWSPRKGGGRAVLSPPFRTIISLHSSVFYWNVYSVSQRIESFLHCSQFICQSSSCYSCRCQIAYYCVVAG